MTQRDAMWAVSIELWQTGAVVTNFMQHEVSALRHASGEALSRLHQTLLMDMLFVRIRPTIAASIVAVLKQDLAGAIDAQGQPLPVRVQEFVDKLISGRIKPRRGRPMSETAIRSAYETRLILEKHNATPEANTTPSERAIRSIATDLKVSEATVSGIVHPRKASRSR